MRPTITRAITTQSPTDRAGFLLATLPIYLVLLGAILLVCSGSARADTRDDVIAASDAALKVVHRALKEEDSGLLASVFTSNGAIMTPDGRTIQGRGTIRASAALLFMTLGSGELVSTRRAITVVDSLGYETGRFTFTKARGANQATAFTGQFVIVWTLEESDWKIATLVGLR